MAKTQFTFGGVGEKNKGMKGMQSLYTSEIDAQAKLGGTAANGQEVRSQLKRTNLTIGSNTGR